MAKLLVSTLICTFRYPFEIPDSHVFFSFPVADGATTFPTFTLLINDTAPIWAYVSPSNLMHCNHQLNHFV
jgi:hypothetical protein